MIDVSDQYFEDQQRKEALAELADEAAQSQARTIPYETINQCLVNRGSTHTDTFLRLCCDLRARGIKPHQ